MKKKIIALLLVSGVFLTACSSKDITLTPQPTMNDPNKILEYNKNPGLGILALHTGRNQFL